MQTNKSIEWQKQKTTSLELLWYNATENVFITYLHAYVWCECAHLIYQIYLQKENNDGRAIHTNYPSLCLSYVHLIFKATIIIHMRFTIEAFTSLLCFCLWCVRVCVFVCRLCSCVCVCVCVSRQQCLAV